MPTYELLMQDKDGGRDSLFYTTETSTLLNADFTPFDFKVAMPTPVYRDAFKISPLNPGLKSSDVKVLKIQLGLTCNYSCSYCSQAHQVADQSVTNLADARKFLANLNWLTAAPERIEFWGGEPLLYWKKIVVLVEALKQRFPRAEMLIITNGSLMTQDKIDFIEKHDINVAVSHDGPGQHLRGPDPFDDLKVSSALLSLWQRRGKLGRMSFNCVLTRDNCSVRDIVDFFVEKVNDPNVAVSVEGVANLYDDNAEAQHRLTPDEGQAMEKIVARDMIDHSSLRSATIRDKMHRFMRSMIQHRPIEALSQKCGMDDVSKLAVDLDGNVMTCQNTGAKGTHKIGHVGKMDEIRLNTSTHFSNRECCNYCPVVHLCAGSCMFLEGELFNASCDNEFHYNVGVMVGTFYHLTGKLLIEILGDVRRPARSKRVIPIKIAA